MDPQAALHELLKEISDDEPDRDRALELLDALRAWIRRGGYIPNATVATITSISSLRKASWFLRLVSSSRPAW